VAFRRAMKAGFGSTDVVDDEEFARRLHDPPDRVLAAFDRGAIVATYLSFATELTVPGGVAVDAGAVTAVTCRATHRRRGILTEMISRDLAVSKERGEMADVLIAAEYPIYGRFGYGPAVWYSDWELDVSVAEFTTPGSGTVEFVDNETFRKEAPAIFEQVRRARPGMIGRTALEWDMRSDLRRPPESKPWPGFRVLVRDDAGTAQGWASYVHKENWSDFRPRATAEVADMCSTSPAVEARLWRFLAELDHVVTVTAGDRPVDELLPLLLVDGRHARRTAGSDFIWLRPLDVAGLLAARRYDVAGHVVVDVVDRLGVADGRFALDASPDGATCVPTTESAEVTLPVATLGAASLGGLRLKRMHDAGWCDEHVAGAVDRADALLATRVPPWCNTWF
ncbi:MAG: GNAT family N-acetyltransferase, partial [Ilumatobacteraceae bacterium]